MSLLKQNFINSLEALRVADPEVAQLQLLKGEFKTLLGTNLTGSEINAVNTTTGQYVNNNAVQIIGETFKL